MIDQPGTLRVFQLVILAVMLFGALGVLVPILPGLLIIWAAALVYGLVTGFTWVGGVLFGVMTVLMLAGSLADNVIMGAKARERGASWLAIGVALVAGVVGSIVFPPFGGLVAALVGLFAVELLRLRSLRQALGSTGSVAVGCGWAAIARFAVGVVMIALWGAWVRWG